MLDIFVQIYLDNFLIYLVTFKEHVQHVRKVLKRVIDLNLGVNLKKCVFHSKLVKFLGYKVSSRGIAMIANRVAAIKEWLAPTNLKSLQSFLGFCNFYRQFIRNYSLIATPLTNLTKKSVEYIWTSKEQQAFDKLKNQFDTADILRHFDKDLPITVETDASDFAIAGVLSQLHSDGLRPVSFFSRKLRGAELNYDTHDKELLAIVECLKGWRHFTMERKVPVEIITDHNNLKYFMTTKTLNRRQVRWAQFLTDFNFKLIHRAGKLNVQADALSR